MGVLIGVWLFQVNYWNSNVNEVQGVVMDQEGKVVHRLFGKWHEGLYCGVAPSAKCIWRPGETSRSVLPQQALAEVGKARSSRGVFNSEITNMDA